MARRHPHVLPGQRGPGDAEGRDRPARPDPAATRAGDARRGRARRAPGRDPAVAEPSAPRAGTGVGPRRGPHRDQRPGAAAGPADSFGGYRRAEPGEPYEQAEAPGRHRLGPHHPRQPAQLPAQAADRGARAARRLRQETAGRGPRRHRMPGPERIDGLVGGLRRGIRRGAGVDPVPAHVGGRLRYVGRRPDRAAQRPGGRPVRRPARRRHGHQPGPGLLPAAHHPPGQYHPRPGQRPVRGRQSGRDAAAGRGRDRRRHPGDSPAGAVRRRRAELRPRDSDRPGRAGRPCLRLHPRLVR